MLRSDRDKWGGHLIGLADWLAIASNTEPFFELRLPDGRSGAAFVSNLDTAATDRRVTIAGVGSAPSNAIAQHRHRTRAGPPVTIAA